MNSKFIFKLGFGLQLISLLQLSQIFAREIRTPLDLRIGPIHYPVWNNQRYENCCFDFDFWAGAYNRIANNAYDKNGWRCKIPLSTLQFNQPAFTMAQAFPDGAADFSSNPWITVSTINPNFNYKEKGIMAGMILGTRAGDCGKIRVGMRARIPYRVVDAQRADSNSCCPLEGETINDVRRLGNDLIPAINPTTGNPESAPLNNSFAYRFDFVSALLLNYPNGTPLVNFKNTDELSHVTIANNTVNPVVFNDITDAGIVNSGAPLIEGNPVNFIVKEDGVAPAHPYAAFASSTYGAYPGEAVDEQPFLNGDGTGGVNNGRVRLNKDTNYSSFGTNTPNQRRLWMVPTAYIDGANPALVGDTARGIGNTIEQIIPGLDPSILTLFQQNNLDFSSQNNMGVGDLDTEYYVAYDFDENFWAELSFGIIFPTAKQVKEPKKVFLFALGNNGHMELRVGTQGGYDVREWLKFSYDAYYSWVLNRTEPILASFSGASVKNLGPQVDAKIHWNYFWGHANFTFLEPCYQFVGFNLGYELYAKQDDKICFCRATMPDFLGNSGTLDPVLAAERTNVIAQKIRVEIFSDTKYCDLFGGWSNVFAGRNAMREVEWYLGFGLKF